MELEQLEKKLQWLDDERRKDKANAAALDSRIIQLEEKLAASKKEISSLRDALSKVKLVTGKLDQAEDALSQVRLDLAKLTDSIEIAKIEIGASLEKKLSSEMEATSTALQDIRKGYQAVQDMKKGQKELDSDITEVKLRLRKMDEKMLETQVAFEQYQHDQKLFDETRKVDNKRLTDIQGEVSAYRKRMDEMRARIDLALENLRNMETRMVDFSSGESERKQNQVAFMEKYNQQQVERDRTWRDWLIKMDSVIQNGNKVELQFKNLEDTLRNVRRTREQLDEAAQKFDRRVNEITEMHRLNEEHFRQEWNTFKADDQKRWANYTLIMDEMQKESDRQGSRLGKRLTKLEQTTQEIGDRLTAIQGEDEKKMQQLVAMLHDWLANYQRIIGKNSDLT